MMSSQPVTVKGFVVRHIPLADGSCLSREVLCKAHIDNDSQSSNRKRGQSGGDSAGRGDQVLFVTHIDPFVEENDIRRHFTECIGPVDSISYKRVRKQSQNPSLRTYGVCDITTLAHVRFFNESAVPKVLGKSSGQFEGTTGSSALTIPTIGSFHTTISSMIHRYRDQDQLQAEIDEAMHQFDEQMEAADGQAAKMNESNDGFTLVTSNAGIRADVPETPKKKKKGRGGVLPDFYRFQHRERQREELARVRAQRLGDEKKVVELRSKGVFKDIVSGVAQ